jgi:hypothetical protein
LNGSRIISLTLKNGRSVPRYRPFGMHKKIECAPGLG